MTTVVYREGVMACDSKLTAGGTYFGDAQKVFFVGEYAVGLAGTSLACAEYIEWLKKHDPFEQIDKELFNENDGFCAIIVRSKTLEVFSFDGRGRPYKLQSPYVAIGSGMDFALGAMEHGASAKEAVEIAARRDDGTGGEIKAYNIQATILDFPKKKKKK